MRESALRRCSMLCGCASWLKRIIISGSESRRRRPCGAPSSGSCSGTCSRRATRAKLLQQQRAGVGRPKCRSAAAACSRSSRLRRPNAPPLPAPTSSSSSAAAAAASRAASASERRCPSVTGPGEKLSSSLYACAGLCGRGGAGGAVCWCGRAVTAWPGSSPAQPRRRQARSCSQPLLATQLLKQAVPKRAPAHPQAEGEDGALAAAGGDRDGAAVRLHQLLHEVEAQARAAVAPRRGHVHLF